MGFRNKLVALGAVLTWAMISGLGCSSAPKNQDEPKKTKDEITQELSQLCSKGSKLACYYYGLDLREAGKLKEAYSNFNKACKDNWAHACAELGTLERKLNHNLDAALKSSQDSCELGDGVGCYNAACYSCLTGKNETFKKTQAMAYLEKAFQVGYGNVASMNNDEDLKCVQGLPGFSKLTQKMRETSKSLYLSEPYHFFVNGLGAAIYGVPDFKVQPGNPMVFYDDSGASSIFFGASLSIQDALKKDQDEVKKFKDAMQGGYELIQEKTFTKNGFPFYFRLSRVTRAGVKTLVAQTMTGNDQYTVYGNGSFPESFKGVYGNTILDSVGSTLLVPWRLPSEKDFIFEFSKPQKLLKYAGESKAIHYYNTLGQLKDTVSYGLILKPILFDEKAHKFDLSYATSVAAQIADGILEPSRASLKMVSTKSPFLGFEQGFSGKDRVTQQELHLKIFLLNTSKKIGQFTLGLQAVAVSEKNSAELKPLEQLVKTLRVKSSVYEKAKSVKAIPAPDYQPKKQ